MSNCALSDLDPIGSVCFVMAADHMDVVVVGHSYSTNSWCVRKYGTLEKRSCRLVFTCLNVCTQYTPRATE